ncbi:hypothetical protein PF010_g27564 [Phytophthora fragariae]|uniref:Uncharacterized protein n=1 Tax=Phytophthora fragariae TaxID=53985 RepID=A0A6G0JTN8_9STRA|nr:hypothetical protein PF010_g27564 [Phytophthora fragariae]KAE9170637.1 hypothetical protein PF004_g27810 [Phytophthora fragariae]
MALRQNNKPADMSSHSAHHPRRSEPARNIKPAPPRCSKPARKMQPQQTGRTQKASDISAWHLPSHGCDTEDAEDDDEEHQAISIPDNPDPGTGITKTIPDMLDIRTIIPDMVPDQAEKEVGAENDDQSGDDRGAAIAAREASRGRVVEDGGAFMHAFARVLTTGLGIYGALRTPKDGSRAFCDADGNSVAV